jgi:hypothetical protein
MDLAPFHCSVASFPHKTAKNFLWVFFSSKDDFCLEMLESVANGRPTHYVPRLVWWNFPKEN